MFVTKMLAASSNENPFIWSGITFLVTSTVFWTVNGILLFISLSNGPISRWFKRYKIQEEKTVDWHKLPSALRQVLFNQIVVGFTMMLILARVSVKRGMTLDRPFPDPLTFLQQLGICIMVEEAGFYYSHRLFHLPIFYKHIHKKHHEWTAPIGIIGIYAHPIEHIVANVFPLWLGVFLAGGSLKFAWVWWSIATTVTSISHSGYHFPFSSSAEAHDFHHLHFTDCYGVMGILDYLHGTDTKFRKTIHYQRHRTVYSFTPVKQLYPDTTKKGE